MRFLISLDCGSAMFLSSVLPLDHVLIKSHFSSFSSDVPHSLNGF